MPELIDTSSLLWDYRRETCDTRSPRAQRKVRDCGCSQQTMKKLGKFEIIARLGQGAMGVVYKARDPFIDRIVALKTLTTSLREDPHHLKRFNSEARSAGSLRHPNIVTIYELGHEGDTPFIAMQFLNGESLDKIIHRMPSLPLSQKIGFIVYVCRALEHAHKQSPPVIHRDVKPANVMVAPDGAVVVVDFGIARLGESTVSQSSGLLIGTLGYMAPQLFRGATADARSDIWATGVMFYELLAYRRPFKGENAAALMSNIILEEHRPITEAAPGTPEELRAIVDRMLAKDVEARYQSMEEVLADLEPIWRRLLESDISVLFDSSRRLYDEGDLMAAKSEIAQILVWDPSNTQARTLSEKISAEVRRKKIVPQLKSMVENAQKLLAQGRSKEAKAEAEAALKLDSSYQAAQEVVSQARAALERTLEIDLAIRNSKQRLEEGALTEAETQLGKVLEIEPNNAAARDQLKQVQDERFGRAQRQQRDAILERGRNLCTNAQYEECIHLLTPAREQFPGDPEILKLLDTASRDQQRWKEKQDLLKQRIREVERLIERQQLTEAIDLSRQTITTIGPDPRLSDTLLKAEKELEFREQKKRQQDETLQMAQALLNVGKFTAANSLVKDALDMRLFPENDSRIKNILEKIDTVVSSGSGDEPARDYIYMRDLPAPESNAQNAAAAAGSSAPGPTARVPDSLSNPATEPKTPIVVDQGKNVADPGWQAEEPQFIGAVEKHLATFIGPMASIIVRRSAPKTSDPGELLAHLASTLHAETDRKAFLARKNELFGKLTHVRPTSETPPGDKPARAAVARLVAASDGGELTPAAVRHASELLAPYLGPLSRVLTERAAKSAPNVRALYSVLADHLQDQRERTKFLTEAGFPEA
jgi:serine/threonine protein kinase